MDDLVKEVLESENTAKKDEKLLDVLKFVSQRVLTRTKELTKYANDIDSDVSQATCKFGSHECVVKLHENSHLLPLVVVDEEEEPDASSTSEDATAMPTFPEFIYQSVQSGMDVINRKQIVIDVRSNVEFTGETVRIFEDVNPYILRSLPPIIASSEFYGPDFPIKQVCPVDPRELLETVPLGTGLDDTELPIPEFQNVRQASIISPPMVEQDSQPSLVLSTPPTTVSTTVETSSISSPTQSEEPEVIDVITSLSPLEIPESTSSSGRSVSLQSSKSTSASENSSVPSISQPSVVAVQHKVHSRMPANLAEIVKNGPMTTKPSSVHTRTTEDSLFNDAESDELSHKEANGMLRVENVTVTKINSNTVVSPDVNNDEFIKEKPQTAPRRKISNPPKPAPRNRVSVTTESKPVIDTTKTVPISTNNIAKPISAPVSTKKIQMRSKVSIFSSSSDEDGDDKSRQRNTAVSNVTLNGKLNHSPAPSPSPVTNTVKIKSSIESNNQRSVSTKKLFDDSDDDDDFVPAAKTLPQPSQPVNAPLSVQSRVPSTGLTSTQQRVTTKPVAARKNMFSSSESD